ncbi:hypothetical protein CFP56_032290 [Quercus suber]|uniref:Uncharacterized protein n=1 Tax=Quercus suber TaxID=58331 RepID=A0AAW0LV59_QUESU
MDQQNTENKEKIRLLPSDHEINKKDSSCLLLVTWVGVRELRSLNLEMLSEDQSNCWSCGYFLNFTSSN